MNPRDLAFIARLGFIARRAGLQITVTWRGVGATVPVYQLVEVGTGKPVTEELDYEELVTRVRLIRDVHDGLQNLAE